MTLHYHGTPITPTSVILTLAGKCFCVSHASPQQVKLVHQIGQSVMLDNGAFTKFTKGRETDWIAYYAWCDEWLDYQTTWAVIPDEIDAGSQQQDALIKEWPHGDRGAPVWHSSEPIDRLLRLCDEWSKVCVGSTDEHWQVLGDPWRLRMDEAFNALAQRHRRMPWLHMLRGMQLATEKWPFASLDSTDVARNHNRPQNVARVMADRWDAANCPAKWAIREPMQQDLWSTA
jgi:hypothetical protein